MQKKFCEQAIENFRKQVYNGYTEIFIRGKKMKKSIPIISGLLAASMVMALAGCGGPKFTNSDEWLKAYDAVPTAAYSLPADPAFGADVVVHDPSVFRDPDSGMYYAFGTHFAVASSPDLIKWTQYASEGASNKLYGAQVTSVLQQGNEWTNGGASDTWAPDVEKINGKYYMYVSMTSGFGLSKSAICVVESNEIYGPYGNERVVVLSDGTGASNAIDPELFYDKDGRLWLVYGSNFGGLFMRELNTKGENVGLPKEGDEYELGKKVWTASTNNEGPFAFYNAETGYYYLMTSYGSLYSDYNMRVARSENPDGPYVDISGTDMAKQAGGGNKLAGNYQFAGGPTDTALGHNSVIKADGKYFVVHHIRNRVDGMHHVEVRQMFFNKDGWPVLAPNRYAGETAGVFTAADVAGTYDIVIHSGGNTVDHVPSIACTLNADGTVSGAQTGSWTLDANGYYITVTLGNATYQGVVVPQWCKYKNAPVVSITATSADGLPIWANSAAKTAQ